MRETPASRARLTSSFTSAAFGARGAPFISPPSNTIVRCPCESAYSIVIRRAPSAQARAGRDRMPCVEVHDCVPRLGAALGPGNEIQVLGRDPALVDEQLPVDELLPVRAAHEDYRDALHLPGLDERERLEQLVERAVPAREGDERTGTHEEVHLADAEVVEPEAKRRRDVCVRPLLVRELDVEAHGLGPDVPRAAVRGLHRARAAARRDDEVTDLARLASRRDDAPELPRLRIPAVALLEARAAEDDHRGPDALLVHLHVGLLELEHEAHAAQLAAREECEVLLLS